MSLYLGDDELNNMHAAYAPRQVEYHYAPVNYGQPEHPLKGANHSDDGFEQDAKNVVEDAVNTGIELAPRQAASQYHWEKLHEYAAWDHALPVNA
ncbi:hypothetical protein AAVH_37675 [Aphelenchoides avenae]|nr:hypothetical protein AAVH_37675 [Aphelenchus avenae]